MNIFFLDYNEKQCAAYHCDKHVNKMIVEHLQMISVALAHYDYLPAKKKDGNYYSTKAYKNHPCTRWVKESSGNFMWLYMMTYHLCIEFHKRYGKFHAGQASLLTLREGEENSTMARLMSENTYPHLGFTHPAQAMPDFCKNPNPVIAYRNYYNLSKWEFARWDKGTAAPFWFTPACWIENKEKYRYYNG